MTAIEDGFLKTLDFVVNNSNYTKTELERCNYKEFMKLYYLTLNKIEKSNNTNIDITKE